ncbi:MAG TPA: hypothetical protein VEK32_05865 [Thermodesulfobacteriota bacterium]|nr:hypothetical protein [Thermodesulfobacteriota bacterium]
MVTPWRAFDTTFLERFDHSVSSVYPQAVLYVILYFAGVELALVVRNIKLEKKNLFVLLLATGTTM